MSPETGHDHEAVSGLVELEGLLVAAHHRQRAYEEGEAFARRMPWLTAHQHQEVTRLYTDRHLALTKEILRTVISRSEELKAEYSQRYERLKKRLTVATLASLIALSTLMVTLQRYGYLS